MPSQDEIRQWREKLGQSGAELSVWDLAVIYVVAREINTLRALHGLPAYTKAQVLTAIRNAAADPTID